jgi:hypothetical protein
MSAERVAFEREVKELEQRWKVRHCFTLGIGSMSDLVYIES